MKKRAESVNSILDKAGHCDFPLIILITILTMIGVVMVFSASYYYSINSTGTPYSYLYKQGFFVVTGFIIMMMMSYFDYHHYRKIILLLALLEVIMLLAVWSPLGETINGATRWIKIYKLSIMPGELCKAVLILFAAAYFSANMRRAKCLKGLLPIAIYTLLCCALIVKQPNLSTALTVFAIALGIAFIAGMQWRYIIIMLGGAVLGVFYLFFINDGYWHSRVASFLNPFADSLGEGFQVVQSLLALATGGVTGLGLGNSVQKNLYLPEPQNDFILAIIGEELGFVGIAAIVILFAVTVWRLIHISINAKDNFGMLIAGGVAVMIGIQVILNIAVVTSSMPPTGVALPFISYGGNALWIFMGLIGIVLNVSRQGGKGARQ